MPARSAKNITTLDQHIVEIVSDSGEGTQTAGQLFGTITARMGNGVWIVEIIPAEIEPPMRSREGASGNRIRFGTELMTNMGDVANVVVAFNEQVPYSRIDVGAFDGRTILFLENKWADSPDEGIRRQYAEARADFRNGDRDAGWARYQKIVDELYACRRYRIVKRWLAER